MRRSASSTAACKVRGSGPRSSRGPQRGLLCGVRQKQRQAQRAELPAKQATCASASGAVAPNTAASKIATASASRLLFARASASGAGLSPASPALALPWRWHCPGAVLALSWHFGTVLALSWRCPGTALALSHAHGSFPFCRRGQVTRSTRNTERISVHMCLYVYYCRVTEPGMRRGVPP